MSTAPGVAPPLVSVVIPAYNRPERLMRLLARLARQTLPASQFEVIVSDDGSTPPIAPRLATLRLPYTLVVIARPNGGPAAARHAGIESARGELLVLIDDDILVPPAFLAEHVAAQQGSAHRVVLGWLRGDPDQPLSLFECWRMRLIQRKVTDIERGARICGTSMYTGNVSLRRADYFAAGGFDRSFRLAEDLELGARLECAGAEFTISREAWAWHAPEPDSVSSWCRRAVEYGASEVRIARKLHHLPQASPWRYLPWMNPMQRQVLLLAVARPALMRSIATAAITIAMRRYRAGRTSQAMGLTALAYALLYFVGVRRETGSWRESRRQWRMHLRACDGQALGAGVRWSKLRGDFAADHEAFQHALFDATSVAPTGSLVGDLMRHTELQSIAAYRLMRFFRDSRLDLAARLMCRLIRHAFAMHLHWDARLAPGVVLKGNGIVATAGVRVGPGCVLCERVTLDTFAGDESDGGVPCVERDVVIGPGAAVLGGISVGEGARIGPRTVLTTSVPAGADVDVPRPAMRPRGRRASPLGTSAGILPLFAQLLT